MGSEQSRLAKSPVHVIDNPLEHERGYGQDWGNNEPVSPNTKISALNTLWQRLWTQKKSATSTSFCQPHASPRRSRPASFPKDNEATLQSQPPSIPIRCVSPSTVKPFRSCSMEYGHHRLQKTTLPAKKQHLIRDLRESNNFQMEAGDLASPYRSHSDDVKKSGMQSMHESTKKKRCDWHSKLVRKADNKMRYVRVIRSSSSVPDLTKKPKKSALKGSRESSHTNLDKFDRNQTDKVPVSPLARNSDSLSVTPPTPENIAKLLFPKSSENSAFFHITHPNLFISQPVLPSSCPAGISTDELSDTSPNALESEKNYPVFSYQIGESLIKASFPKPSEGSPLLRVSNSSVHKLFRRSPFDANYNPDEASMGLHIQAPLEEVSQEVDLSPGSGSNPHSENDDGHQYFVDFVGPNNSYISPSASFKDDEHEQMGDKVPHLHSLKTKLIKYLYSPPLQTALHADISDSLSVTPPTPENIAKLLFPKSSENSAFFHITHPNLFISQPVLPSSCPAGISTDELSDTSPNALESEKNYPVFSYQIGESLIKASFPKPSEGSPLLRVSNSSVHKLFRRSPFDANYNPDEASMGLHIQAPLEEVSQEVDLSPGSGSNPHSENDDGHQYFVDFVGPNNSYISPSASFKDDEHEQMGDKVPHLHSLKIRRDSLGMTLNGSHCHAWNPNGADPADKLNHGTKDDGDDQEGEENVNTNEYSSEHESDDDEVRRKISEVPIIEVLSPSLCAAGYGPTGRHLEAWLPKRKLCEQLLQFTENSGNSSEISWEKRKKLLQELANYSFSLLNDTSTQEIFLRFSKFVEVQELEPEDRMGDRPWTRLTPIEKARIRRELNDYKMAEMSVHNESRQYTRFHPP
ncbi:hypothetical protein AHF37_03111 [Paragonimus kellicotti]|nr:hypothetical protein AHF37_03111 [Paragonimus kellicotti]